MTARSRVLLIGPLPVEGDVVGGTKVSFAAMARQLCAEPSLDVEVFDISRRRAGLGRVRRLFGELRTLARLLARVGWRGARPDVVLFNASSGGLLSSGPLVYAACRLRGAKLMTRVFGGDLDLFLERAVAPTRWAFRRTIARSDRLLLQTHALCGAFQDEAAPERLQWWPTTRDLAASGPAGAGSGRRFLFLGQLRREKGIAEAVEAARSLPEGATLTIVGPPMPGFDLDAARLPASCRAVGPVPPEEVPRVLAEHDVLVFPTYHAGEGMPGIVIEAMQTGLPVIATRWRAVPELVEDGVSGLLVDPKDARALGEAMGRVAVDDGLMHRLREGALRRGDEFRSTRWEPRLVEWIHEVAGSAPRTVELSPAAPEAHPPAPLPGATPRSLSERP